MKKDETRRLEMVNDPRVRNNGKLTAYGKRLREFTDSINWQEWGDMFVKRWTTYCYMKSRNFETEKDRIAQIETYQEGFFGANKWWRNYVITNELEPGYLYIFSNPGMPGHLKIGATTDKPKVRANDLYDGKTGVPAPFVIEYERFTFECWQAEKFVHNELSSKRINRSREFFKIKLGEAKSKTDTVMTVLEESHYRKFRDTIKEYKR